MWVRFSPDAASAWSKPAVISEQNTLVDDLCAVVALPGRIAVLWPDQDHDAVYLRLPSDLKAVRHQCGVQ